MLRNIFLISNPMPLQLMNVMFPRKAEPTKVRPCSIWEPHNTPQLSRPTVHRRGASRRETQPVNHKPPDAPHNAGGSCLQMPGFARDKFNLLGFLEEKLEKTSS